MPKLIYFVSRLPGTTHEAFVDYYESRHAPLAMTLFPMISDYRRNHVPRPAHGSEPAFDTITELTFEDEAAYQAYRAATRDPDLIARLRADEARFLDGSKTHGFLVDERISV